MPTSMDLVSIGSRLVVSCSPFQGDQSAGVQTSKILLQVQQLKQNMYHWLRHLNKWYELDGLSELQSSSGTLLRCLFLLTIRQQLSSLKMTWDVLKRNTLISSFTFLINYRMKTSPFETVQRMTWWLTYLLNDSLEFFLLTFVQWLDLSPGWCNILSESECKNSACSIDYCQDFAYSSFDD